MAVLADIKEVAGHSELNADAQFDQLLSELQQRLASYQDRLLDVEDGTIALFKLAVLGTRKGDDVEAIAAVWKNPRRIPQLKVGQGRGRLSATPARA